jgi:hypothetical protein
MSALAAVRHQNLIREIDERVRANSNPHLAHALSVRLEREAQEKIVEAAIARMDAKYQKRRREKLAGVSVEALPTSGRGWVLLDRPHEALERLVRDAWDLGFHGIPWPDGLRVRWADLSMSEGGTGAYGMHVPEFKLILFDERAHQRRTPQQFLKTILHELAHVTHPHEVHGNRFASTLKRLVDYVIPESDDTDNRPPHPEPVKDRRWDGRPVHALTTSGGWEYR